MKKEIKCETRGGNKCKNKAHYKIINPLNNEFCYQCKECFNQNKEWRIKYFPEAKIEVLRK